MKTSDLSNIGSKIRKERRKKALAQSDLSKKLEISASYLNLIESGRRTITVPLLIKIGNELGISLKDLTIESNKRLLSDVMEVLSNELFEDLDITNQETAEFISNNPNIAKALLTLSDTYKSFIPIIARLILGFIFVYFSWDKILDPRLFANVIKNYDITPFGFEDLVALILPFIEFFIGIFLILGIFVDISATISLGLLFMFVLMIGQAYLRGKSIDCGCLLSDLSDTSSSEKRMHRGRKKNV